MVEITNPETALKWLEQQDHQTQIWFALRSALRAIPGVYSSNEDVEPSNLTVALPCFRTGLLAAAAAVTPRLNTLTFEKRVTSAISFINVSATDGGRQICSHKAAESALNCITSRNSAAHAAKALDYCAQAVDYDSIGSVSFASATHDSQNPNIWNALWPGYPETGLEFEMPGTLGDEWADLRGQMGRKRSDWEFWVEWYQGILKGIPLPWSLTQSIALEVKNADWDTGAGRVAEAIAPIYLPYKLERQIAELQAELAFARLKYEGIGDNNLPEPIENLTFEQLPTEIWNNLEALRTEKNASHPDPNRLRLLEQRLTEGAAKLGRLLKDVAYDETKQVVSGAIGAGIALNWNKIQLQIAKISQTVIEWIAYLN
ncbi:hypothetical protein [uncultured Roseobacter sp.]|uniref:hypothetical protein n=1 Tax=uncultured Roseobacter sp. TaxID=114847 RepID=UPI00262C170D|nr:hypothetical protein [uncultured Roseobacter sp.]